MIMLKLYFKVEIKQENTDELVWVDDLEKTIYINQKYSHVVDTFSSCEDTYQLYFYKKLNSSEPFLVIDENFLLNKNPLNSLRNLSRKSYELDEGENLRLIKAFINLEGKVFSIFGEKSNDLNGSDENFFYND